MPWWITTTWTLTPCFLSRCDSALIRVASSRNVSPAVASAETRSGVDCSSAPMTPTLTPLTLNTTDGLHPVGCLAGRGLDDVRGQEREVRPVLVREQPLDAVVELVVAVGRRVQAPGVLDVDRRHVVEQERVRRRGADVVAAGEDQARAGQARQLLVEHRRQVRGAADRDVDVVVADDRRRVELAVEVVDADDRDRLDRRCRPSGSRSGPGPGSAGARGCRGCRRGSGRGRWSAP